MAGEVYVIVISDDPRRFEPGSKLLHEDGRTLTVESSRKHRDRVMVRFEGFASRESAETLRGALFIDAADVRELADDEYWPDELVGCSVIDLEGNIIGTVESVIEGRAHDLFQVSTEHGESLVPVVKEIVRDIDTSARRIVIDPPQGLFDP